MLIVSRTPGESVIIGDNIVVTILSVRGNHVRVGIAAPKDIRVDREEVRERILREQARQSSQAVGL